MLAILDEGAEEESSSYQRTRLGLSGEGKREVFHCQKRKNEGRTPRSPWDLFSCVCVSASYVYIEPPSAVLWPPCSARSWDWDAVKGGRFQAGISQMNGARNSKEAPRI